MPHRSTFAAPRRAGIAGVAILLAGCESSPAAPVALEPCTGPVTVSVSSGLTPRFTWTPACTVIGLLVENGADDVWFVLADSDSGFGPGVRYGILPAGATQNVAPVPLVAGVVHDVILYRGTRDTPAIATVREFTP